MRIKLIKVSLILSYEFYNNVQCNNLYVYKLAVCLPPIKILEVGIVSLFFPLVFVQNDIIRDEDKIWRHYADHIDTIIPCF